MPRPRDLWGDPREDAAGGSLPLAVEEYLSTYKVQKAVLSAPCHEHGIFISQEDGCRSWMPPLPEESPDPDGRSKTDATEEDPQSSRRPPCEPLAEGFAALSSSCREVRRQVEDLLVAHERRLLALMTLQSTLRPQAHFERVNSPVAATKCGISGMVPDLNNGSVSLLPALPSTGEASGCPRRSVPRNSYFTVGEDVGTDVAWTWDMKEALGYGQELTQGVQQSTRMSSTIKDRVCYRKGYLEAMLEHSLAENICGIVVLANAVCIGVQANMRAVNPEQACGWVGWATLNLCFNTFFVLELAARMVAFRGRFVFGPDWQWNLFDSIIVVCGIIDEVIQRSLPKGDCGDGTSDVNSFGFTALRVVRMLRLVRIVKALRVMPIFTELRIMVNSILRCIIPLAWACLLLLVIFWIFAVYYLNLTSDYIVAKVQLSGDAALSQPDVVLLTKFFGSLWRAILTLLQTVTGGMEWEKIAEALEILGLMPVILYAFFVALSAFAVLNVITGVFVENAMKMAHKDQDILIQDRSKRMQQYMQEALTVFHEADRDHSGTVTWREFQDFLDDKRMQAFFASLELDSVEARRLFRMLDTGSTGAVSAEEFVAGCMCLRGGAKTLDVAKLILEHQKAHAETARFMQFVYERLGRPDGGSPTVSPQPKRASTSHLEVQ